MENAKDLHSLNDAADSLDLHLRLGAYLMNSHSIQIIHLVELINADNAPVCQNHGSSFQPPLTCKPGCLLHL